MNRFVLPCALVAALAAPGLAAAAAPSLLSAQPAMMLATSADTSLAAIAQNPANTILRQASANTAVLEAATPAIAVALEPGIELTFERAAAESFADGSLVWRGRLDADAFWSDAPAGTDDYALLVRNGSMLTGDIRHGGKVYEIRPLHSGGHVVYTQDPSMLPMHDEGDLRQGADFCLDVELHCLGLGKAGAAGPGVRLRAAPARRVVRQRRGGVGRLGLDRGRRRLGDPGLGRQRPTAAAAGR